MRNRLAFSTMVLVGVLAIVFGVVFYPDTVDAQQVKTEPYRVVRGATLWELAEQKCGVGFRWTLIYNLNPRFNDENRLSRRNGRDIVFLKPGEIINIPTDACEYQSDIVQAASVPVLTDQPPIVVETAHMPGWWFLLALSAAAIIWAIIDRRRRLVASLRERLANLSHSYDALNGAYIEQQRGRERVLRDLAEARIRNLALAPRMRGPHEDPEGQPFMPEGVTEDNFQEALRTAAQIEFVRRNRDNPMPLARNIFVREGVPGYIVSGTYFVTYADGSRGPDRVAVRHNADTYARAWRCVAEHDGQEAVTYVLTICANGLGTPVNGENIEFEPDAEQPKHAIRYSSDEVRLVSDSPITVKVGERVVGEGRSVTLRSFDQFRIFGEQVALPEVALPDSSLMTLEIQKAEERSVDGTDIDLPADVPVSSGRHNTGFPMDRGAPGAPFSEPITEPIT